MFIVIFARENSRRCHSICLSNWRLTAIITRRCLHGCEPCQFPVVVLGFTPRALRARRNTAVEFSINNVTDKVRRKTRGHSTHARTIRNISGANRAVYNSFSPRARNLMSTYIFIRESRITFLIESVSNICN